VLTNELGHHALIASFTIAAWGMHVNSWKGRRRPQEPAGAEEKGRVAQILSARMICETEVSVNIRGHYYAPIAFLNPGLFRGGGQQRAKSSKQTNQRTMKPAGRKRACVPCRESHTACDGFVAPTTMDYTTVPFTTFE
jgi:hypothetical protein